MIEDHWTLINNVLQENEWVDCKTLMEKTGIIRESILDLLKTATKRDIIEKEFIHYNNSEQWNGRVKRYKFMWRLKR